MDPAFDDDAAASAPVAFSPGRLIGSVRARFEALPAAPFAVAAVAVALVTEYGLTQFSGTVPKTAYGFVAAIALLAVAAYATSRRSMTIDATRPAETSQTDAFTLSTTWEAALVAGVVLLAAFFRFWHFSSFPPGIWYDEGVNAFDATSLIQGDHTRIWFDSVTGRSTLYLYLLAGSFKLFGYTIFALRIVPALAGLGAVVAFYFLARRLVGQVPAIIATAFFAMSRWAVTFSRVSWEASLQPLLEILAVFFLVRALDTKSKISFALAGVALSLGLYTYIAFRVVPMFIALLLLYVAATQWRAIRINLLGLAIFAVTSIIVIAPLANFALHNQDRFTERTRQVNVFGEVDDAGNYQPLRDNIKKSIKMLNVEGDYNGRHNLPYRPMLDEVSAALLVLGLAVSVWSFRSWRRGSIAPWLVLSLIPGALTLQIENPSAIRGIGALPAIFLLIGMAVATILRSMESSRAGRMVFVAIAVALVTGGIGINYYDIFEKQAHSQMVYEAFQSEFRQIGDIVADRADDDHVYVTHYYLGHQAVSFLGHDKTFAGYTAATDLVFPADGKDVLLVMDVNQVQIVPVLQRLYPNLTREDHVDPFGRTFFSRVRVPAADVAASHELRTTVRGASLELPSTFRIDREWTEADLANGPIDVAWDGYLWSPAIYGPSEFLTQSPGPQLTIEIDGKPIAPAAGGGYSTAIPLGEHRIKITAHIDRPGRIEIKQSIDGASSNTADAVYGTSLGDRGFRVVYRNGTNFSTPPIAISAVPFAVPVPGEDAAQAIEYVGDFDVSYSGEFSFVLDGATSSQLLVDDELIVDNAGAHPRRRVEGTVELAAGTHRLSLQYVVSSFIMDLQLFMGRDGALEPVTGAEVHRPTGVYTPPAVVTIAPATGPLSQATGFPGLSAPMAIGLAPDGTLVAGGDKTIVLIGQDGLAKRTLTLDVKSIYDLAVMDDGTIVVMDAVGLQVVLVRPDGTVLRRIEGLASGAGLTVDGNIIYAASPSGGIVYRIALPGGDLERLPISFEEAPVRASQPADIVIGGDGALYIADFDKRIIVKSPDGISGMSFKGVGGAGGLQPRLATSGKLVFITEPGDDRILAFDTSGRQRGLYIFPSRIGGNLPIGIAAAPDGSIYVALVSGFIQKLQLTIPPATQDQLDALP